MIESPDPASFSSCKSKVRAEKTPSIRPTASEDTFSSRRQDASDEQNLLVAQVPRRMPVKLCCQVKLEHLRKTGALSLGIEADGNEVTARRAPQTLDGNCTTASAAPPPAIISAARTDSRAASHPAPLQADMTNDLSAPDPSTSAWSATLLWWAVATLLLLLNTVAVFFLLRESTPSRLPPAAQASLLHVVQVSAAPRFLPVPPVESNPPPLPAISPEVNDEVDSFIAAAREDVQKGSLEDALSACNRALDLDPRSVPAFYNRGLIKAAQNDIDGAIADYSQALESDPRFAPAAYSRGVARHAQGDVVGALRDLDEAIQADPKREEAWSERGLIEMQEAQYQKAILDDSRALQLDPGLGPCYFDRAICHLAQDEMTAARNDLDAFCARNSGSALTDYARLYIWLSRAAERKSALANQELAQAMDNQWHANDESLVSKLAEFLMGRIGEDELRTAAASPMPLQEQQQECEVWYFIGMRQLACDDRPMAVAALRKCVETQARGVYEYLLAKEQMKKLEANITRNP